MALICSLGGKGAGRKGIAGLAGHSGHEFGKVFEDRRIRGLFYAESRIGGICKVIAVSPVGGGREGGGDCGVF